MAKLSSDKKQSKSKVSTSTGSSSSRFRSHLDKKIFEKLNFLKDSKTLSAIANVQTTEQEKKTGGSDGNPMFLVRKFLDLAPMSDPEGKEAFCHIAAGGNLAELYGMSPEEKEAVYTVAYQYYQIGRYDEACHILILLCLLDTWNGKYFHALANAQVALKRYKNAFDNYAMAILTDPENPLFYLHLSEAYLLAKKEQEAFHGFHATMKLCRDGDPLHEKISEMCRSKLDLLKEKHKQNKQKNA